VDALPGAAGPFGGLRLPEEPGHRPAPDGDSVCGAVLETKQEGSLLGGRPSIMKEDALTTAAGHRQVIGPHPRAMNTP